MKGEKARMVSEEEPARLLPGWPATGDLALGTASDSADRLQQATGRQTASRWGYSMLLSHSSRVVWCSRLACSRISARSSASVPHPSATTSYL
jgi:hypothetical protein